MENPLSLGKMRALQCCSTDRGHLTILAADHRDALRVLMSPTSPGSVSSADLTAFKLALVEHLGTAASAVLLDPTYGLAPAITRGALPGRVGLLCALEEQGYLGGPLERKTTIIPGWSVEQAARSGANGVKLLLHYHPEAGAATQAQEQLVRSIAAECRRYDIPFFLEPISFSLDPSLPKGSREFAAKKTRVVIESARRLAALGPDLLKLEFPVEAKYEPRPKIWAEACAELDAACPIPWVLLSGGDPFTVFADQLKVACQNGASGFAVGRAVWQEAATLSGPERGRWLTQIGRQRLAELNAIVAEYATPWQRRFPDSLKE